MKPDNVLIFGGTGFLGRKLVSALLQTKRYRLILPYRGATIPAEWLLEVQKNANLEPVAFSGDFLPWILGQDPTKSGNLLLAISLIGKREGEPPQIFESNLGYVGSLITLFGSLKAKNPQIITVYFGSIAEYKKFGELSLYACLKREARKRLEESGVCDLIVTHSILDDNKEKIAADLKPVLPDIEKSSYLLDRVVLSTLSSSFLCRAFICFIEHYLSHVNVKSGSELVILEQEQSLRQFLTKIFDRKIHPEPKSHDMEIRYLDYLTEVVNEKLASNNTLRIRMLTFIELARMNDPVERERKNHYLHFGRVSDLMKMGNIRNVLFSRSDLICLSMENRYLIYPTQSPFLTGDANGHGE
jgi:hypothetical protein